MTEPSIEETTILLLCIGLDTDRKQVSTLNSHIIFSIFRPFGPLKKIVLFSKSPIVKAFLEYFHKESAQNAIEFAHDAFIDKWGRARLYPSALTELKFSNRYIDVLDCQDFERTDSVFHPQNDSASEIKPHLNLKLFINKLNTKYNEGFTPVSKIDIFDPDTQHTTPNEINDLFRMKSQFLLNINSPVIPSSYKNSSYSEMPNLFSDIKNKSLQSPRENENTVSNVILFSNIDENILSALEIFNLFSCMGNITKILFMSNMRKALVEFSSQAYAESCLLYMNNRPFGISKIKVNFSKFQSIDLKKNNKTENSQNFNEVIVVIPSMNRYVPLQFSVVTPPSSSLLVKCKKLEGIEVIDIVLVLQSVTRPQSYKLVDQSFENVVNSFVIRISFKFASIAEAMLVLAKTHNYTLNGVLLEVSFAERAT
jgi:hypothetical protein